MFGLFSTKDIVHPRLGTLSWRAGRWEGRIALPELGLVRILIAGSRKGLLPEAEAEALRLPAELPGWKNRIAEALFEHAQPYLAEGIEDSGAGLHRIRDTKTAWDNASIEAAVFEAIDGVMSTELCFTTTWDEEHTLGARFQRGEWLELCGSTLVP